MIRKECLNSKGIIEKFRLLSSEKKEENMFRQAHLLILEVGILMAFSVQAFAQTPNIRDIKASPGENSVTVTWTTDIEATSVVEYGTNPIYSQSESVMGLLKIQKVVLSGLEKGATYHYRVLSIGPLEGQASSSDATFTTTMGKRFEIYPFVGEVINNFSSSARMNYAPQAEDKERMNRMAGLEWEYRLNKKADDTERWYVFGRALHSARDMEVKCRENDPDCPGIPDTSDFYKILRNSDTLEWALGVRYLHAFNDGETGWYAKIQGGFLRAEEAGDDMVDNHFFGFGIEHLEGVFKRSCMEIGIGRSDLFAPDKRTPRFKANILLVYTPGKNKQAGEGGIMGFFIKGLLDSDYGPGSDDYQILTGLVFDIGRLFEILNK